VNSHVKETTTAGATGRPAHRVTYNISPPFRPGFLSPASSV